jgi:lipoate-protein ligase A
MKPIETWRLIDSGAGLASENMAIDEAVLNSCKQGESLPILHFYAWMVPSITLGYQQDLSETIQINECCVRGIPVVRRITGGRAVVHHQDVSFSLIFPSNDSVIPSGIGASYRMIARGFIEGLKSLGINADLSDSRSLRNTCRKEDKNLPACFLTRIRFEIIVSGRKLLGFAQRRIGDWVLLQGTIMIHLDRRLWSDFLRYPNSLDSNKIMDRLQSEMTSASEVLEKDINILSIKKALLNGLSKVLGIRFTVQGLVLEEWKEVDLLAGSKYRDLLGEQTFSA